MPGTRLLLSFLENSVDGPVGVFHEGSSLPDLKKQSQSDLDLLASALMQRAVCLTSCRCGSQNQVSVEWEKPSPC